MESIFNGTYCIAEDRIGRVEQPLVVSIAGRLFVWHGRKPRNSVCSAIPRLPSIGFISMHMNYSQPIPISVDVVTHIMDGSRDRCPRVVRHVEVVANHSCSTRMPHFVARVVETRHWPAELLAPEITRIQVVTTKMTLVDALRLSFENLISETFGK